MTVLQGRLLIVHASTRKSTLRRELNSTQMYLRQALKTRKLQKQHTSGSCKLTKQMPERSTKDDTERQDPSRFLPGASVVLYRHYIPWHRNYWPAHAAIDQLNHLSRNGWQAVSEASSSGPQDILLLELILAVSIERFGSNPSCVLQHFSSQ